MLRISWLHTLDIIKYEVKRALRSITMNKASGGNGILAELLQILKDNVAKMLHSVCQQIWKPLQWLKDWKMSVFLPILRKDKVKECSNYHIIELISHVSRVKLKVLQARLQLYMNWKLPDVQAGLKSQWNQRSNCQHSLDHKESKGIPEKQLLLHHWLH